MTSLGHHCHRPPAYTRNIHARLHVCTFQSQKQGRPPSVCVCLYTLEPHVPESNHRRLGGLRLTNSTHLERRYTPQSIISEQMWKIMVTSELKLDMQMFHNKPHSWSGQHDEAGIVHSHKKQPPFSIKFSPKQHEWLRGLLLYRQCDVR